MFVWTIYKINTKVVINAWESGTGVINSLFNCQDFIPNKWFAPLKIQFVTWKIVILCTIPWQFRARDKEPFLWSPWKPRKQSRGFSACKGEVRMRLAIKCLEIQKYSLRTLPGQTGFISQNKGMKRKLTPSVGLIETTQTLIYFLLLHLLLKRHLFMTINLITSKMVKVLLYISSF